MKQPLTLADRVRERIKVLRKTIRDGERAKVELARLDEKRAKKEPMRAREGI